jgi:hypothetical protein
MKKQYRISLDFNKVNKFQLEQIIKLKYELAIVDTNNKPQFFNIVEDKTRSLGFSFEHVVTKEHLYKFNGITTLDVFLDLEYEDVVALTHVPDNEIMTKRYKDFDNGTYLVAYVDLKRFVIQFDMFDKFPNYIAIAGCFDFDVEHDYKILSYMKLKNG